MSVFKHRFIIKKPKQKKHKKTKTKRAGPTGVDGAQAGKSVLDWEKGTIFRT